MHARVSDPAPSHRSCPTASGIPTRVRFVRSRSGCRRARCRGPGISSTCLSLLSMARLNQSQLNENQVAQHLGVSIATVRRWRARRTGPRFRKIGGASVRFGCEDLRRWIESQELAYRWQCSEMSPAPKPDDNWTASEAALWYAAHGFPVFPVHEVRNGRCTRGRGDCEHPGKHQRTATDKTGIPKMLRPVLGSKSAMNLILSQEQSVPVLSMEGRLDARGAAEFQAACDRLPSAASHVVLDLTRTDYISSVGLGELFRLEKLLRQRHGRTILAGLSSNVQGVLATTGLLNQFQHVSLVTEAVELALAGMSGSERFGGASDTRAPLSDRAQRPANRVSWSCGETLQRLQKTCDRSFGSCFRRRHRARSLPPRTSWDLPSVSADSGTPTWLRMPSAGLWWRVDSPVCYLPMSIP